MLIELEQIEFQSKNIIRDFLWTLQ